MFFSERIKSIKDTDRVLEVGPGGTPFKRSDVLLEKIFDEEDAREQRGHTEPLKTETEVIFYEGNKFPFMDNEFDYVICSHVLEHIHSGEIEFFISELQRVAKKGYLEFPTIYYDYIYNFPKHLTFLLYDAGVINYIGKEDTKLNSFLPVQQFFYHSAIAGHTSLINSLKLYFFQGFEWDEKINLKKVKNIDEVVYCDDIFNGIPKVLPTPDSYFKRIKKKVIFIVKKLNGIAI